MAFVPHLYIGVGETGAFFTLRETYLHERYANGCRYTEVRSFHHFNLSQDADEAFEKARAFAERNLIQLNTTREQLTEQMRDIQRANAEELERRERAARELGDYPHKAMAPRKKPAQPKGWFLVKLVSPNDPGYKFTIAPRLIEEYGMPKDFLGDEMIVVEE